jgi:prohibitin 1
VKARAYGGSVSAGAARDPDDLEFSPGLRGTRERVDLWWEENRFYVYCAGLLWLLALAVLWPRVVITVPAGHRGVLFRTLHGGSVIDRTWDEGVHVILPWDKLTIYETRVMESDLSFSVLTKDGLALELEAAVRYSPVVAKLGVLHQELGPDYFKRVVAPDIQAALRATVGDRTAYELYSTEGDILQEARREAMLQLAKQHIDLEALLLKRIVLPTIVREAVEQKHRQEQMVLEYTFRLVREEKEAERKRTEAAGIRDFQNILADGIAPDVLRWRGIEATLELARSSNAKIVVIGGDGRLPVMLDAPNPPVVTPTGTEPARERDARPSGRDRVATNPPADDAPSPQP